MIFDTFAGQPDFPFPRYFDDVAQYSLAQQYWLTVLRSVPAFDDTQWLPVVKAVDLADDMYLGLVVDVERLSDRKSIRIYTSSLDGRANFLLKEDLETAKAMGANSLPKDVAAAHAEAVQSGMVRAPFVTLDQAQVEAQTEFAQSAGFEAGVGARGFFIEDPNDPMGGDVVDGEELSIISTLHPDNEAKARHAIDLFVAEGPATRRVNDVFVPPEPE